MPAETEIRYEEELGKQYMKPLDEYIIYEEEPPLSDKQIEALSYLIRANKPDTSMGYTILFMGVLCAILYFVYC